MPPRKSRTQEVQDSIMNLIIEQSLEPGDLVPTESQLIEITGASRSAVREALKIMETLGIVQIRRGNGTYVANTSMDALTTQLSFGAQRDLTHGCKTLFDSVQLREFLEQGLAREMCSIENQRLGRAAAIIDQMAREAERGDISAATDREFHTTLYLPLGNTLTTPMLGSFFDAYQQVDLDPAGAAPAVESVARHAEIVQAIRRRDPDEAAQAVTRHFDLIRTRLEHQSSVQ